MIDSSPLALSAQDLRPAPFERRASIAAQSAQSLVRLSLTATFNTNGKETAFLAACHGCESLPLDFPFSRNGSVEATNSFVSITFSLFRKNGSTRGNEGLVLALSPMRPSLPSRTSSAQEPYYE